MADDDRTTISTASTGARKKGVEWPGKLISDPSSAPQWPGRLIGNADQGGSRPAPKLTPVQGNPFADPPKGVRLVPVEGDPFAARPTGEPKLTPVQGNPFEGPGASSPRELTIHPLPQGDTQLKPAPTALERVAGAVPHVLDLPKNYAQENLAGREQIAQGVNEFRETPMRGALDVGMGGLRYVASPFSALTKTFVGDPVRRLTGSDKAGDLADTAASILLPGPKGVKALERAPGLQTAEKIFSPSSVDDFSRAAEGAIRRETGRAARASEGTASALEQHRSLVAGLDEAGRRDFIRYVEGRSQGAAPPDPKLRPLADTMREAFEGRMRRLQTLPSAQQMRFVEDYFPHIWTDPKKAAGVRAGGKEGRTGFTKERSIPTIEDGIAAGLEPKTLDPIEATLDYITNADKFIATNSVFDEARTVGTVKYFAPGHQPEGWVTVNGRLGEKAGMHAYAPEGWARVYNNYIDPGITGPWRDVYDKAQHASNALTAMELGLSGYHAMTMAQEGVVSEVARALQEFGAGKPGAALKSLAAAPLAPVHLARTGSKLEKVYLGTAPASAEMRKIADLLTDAGGRARSLRAAPDYKFSGAGSFWTAWRQGTLKSQLARDGARIKDTKGLALPDVVFKNVGRVMDTVAQPLFEKYIPRMKNGAFYENMASWMKRNPGAPREQQLQAARDIWDSVDNRFGELVQDNVFWNKTLKQIAQLSMLSYSWNLGTVREIGGGVKDLANHELTNRASYVIALPLVYGLESALYQRLKTGEAPADMQDLVAPRTGGLTPDGTPERVVLPGYMKDVFGWYQDPLQEAANKRSRLLSLAQETVTNKDWRGAPIAPPSDPNKSWMENVPSWLSAHLNNVVQSFVPITAKQLMRGKGSDTGLSSAESVMGMQPAGMRYTDPERLDQILRQRGAREWKAKERFDARQSAKYGGTD